MVIFQYRYVSVEIWGYFTMNRLELEYELERAYKGYNEAVKEMDSYKAERFGEAINYLKNKLEKLKDE